MEDLSHAFVNLRTRYEVNYSRYLQYLIKVGVILAGGLLSAYLLVVDEYLVSSLLADFKSWCRKIQKKKEKQHKIITSLCFAVSFHLSSHLSAIIWLSAVI